MPSSAHRVPRYVKINKSFSRTSIIKSYIKAIRKKRGGNSYRSTANGSRLSIRTELILSCGGLEGFSHFLLPDLVLGLSLLTQTVVKEHHQIPNTKSPIPNSQTKHHNAPIKKKGMTRQGKQWSFELRPLTDDSTRHFSPRCSISADDHLFLCVAEPACRSMQIFRVNGVFLSFLVTRR